FCGPIPCLLYCRFPRPWHPRTTSLSAGREVVMPSNPATNLIDVAVAAVERMDKYLDSCAEPLGGEVVDAGADVAVLREKYRTVNEYIQAVDRGPSRSVGRPACSGRYRSSPTRGSSSGRSRPPSRVPWRARSGHTNWSRRICGRQGTA